MMRTNKVIDDQLMRETLKATGLRTKKEALELALHSLLRLRQQANMRQLRGKIPREGELEQMRTDK